MASVTFTFDKISGLDTTITLSGAGQTHTFGPADGVTMNDIEVPVEIKSNNPDTQIKINNGSWVNVRSI